MKFKLLICDLDNTLYDWVAYFVPSFYAMVDKVVEQIGCDRETLLDDFREVHQQYHDSEHPFALLETRTVRKHFKGLERRKIAQALDPAFHTFNSARKKNITLNPGVKKTLNYIFQRGIRLVAHTDSQLFGAVDRLTRLSLTECFLKLYCQQRPKTNHPKPEVGQSWLNNFPMQNVCELSMNQLKPDPAVLTEICNAEDVAPYETAYVGDSIARDILMAKSAGVYGIWAKYGAILHTNNYEKLVRISHWTKEDVEKEKKLREKAKNIQPDFVAENCFEEILSVIFPNERIDSSRHNIK